ncbi:hypothetical protein MIND_00920800 [Mycena indigotica]|uniref:Uncharacterized protein n=1 Tax=Mycena indigotica TaxID=2126181 RepID=A0A8H6SFH2_9AGAR|nr:uncharacterized protein MIND_00920800 [Mycena indigotica]KAF7296890.1 hypothetical protein MIND_00920800 [Mycena indigotica]
MALNLHRHQTSKTATRLFEVTHARPPLLTHLLSLRKHTPIETSLQIQISPPYLPLPVRPVTPHRIGPRDTPPQAQPQRHPARSLADLARCVGLSGSIESDSLAEKQYSIFPDRKAMFPGDKAIFPDSKTDFLAAKHWTPAPSPTHAHTITALLIDMLCVGPITHDAHLFLSQRATPARPARIVRVLALESAV